MESRDETRDSDEESIDAGGVEDAEGGSGAEGSIHTALRSEVEWREDDVAEAEPDETMKSIEDQDEVQNEEQGHVRE